MRARTSATRVTATALVVAFVVLGPIAPIASAQANCTFDEVTGVAQVALVGGEPTVLAREAEAITLDAAACGTATVTNTETIAITGSGPGQADDLTIDLSGGPFAPGRDAEIDGGQPEIEISVDLPGGGTLSIAGGADGEAVTLGTGGVNLDASEAVDDADVTLTGAIDVELAGHAGADRLSVAGGDGTGDPASGATIDGGLDDDTILGAAGGSTIDGGEGADTMDYSLAPSAVAADLAAGTAQPEAAAAPDSLLGIENLTGSAGDDRLVGDAGANQLSGGLGDDALDGGAGDDTLSGGQGTDVVEMKLATEAVDVDLLEGTATGMGADTLNGIENAIGSTFKDHLRGSAEGNMLRGGRGSDEIHGNAGPDEVFGGIGFDRLFGGADGDTLDGSHGKDQLNGGDGKDVCSPGPDPDSWTGCENVKP